MVRIVDDADAVRAMQNGHGGWNNQMKKVSRITVRNRFIDLLSNRSINR